MAKPKDRSMARCAFMIVLPWLCLPYHVVAAGSQAKRARNASPFGHYRPARRTVTGIIGHGLIRGRFIGHPDGAPIARAPDVALRASGMTIKFRRQAPASRATRPVHRDTINSPTAMRAD